MIGVIVDCLAVVLGGLLGTWAGRALSDDFKEKMNMIMGLGSITLGVPSLALVANLPAVVFAVVAGTALGLAVRLGGWIDRGAGCLQRAASRLLGGRQGGNDALLVTAIVLFCASGTGIYGCLAAGMTGDSSILISKAILDLFTAMIFACTLGAVTSLVALPQLAVFALLLACAKLILPLATPDMIADFKACGGCLIIATGFRILKLKEFPIADMLLAMVLVMPLSWAWTAWILPLVG